MKLIEGARIVKALTPRLGSLETELKNKALLAIARALLSHRAEIEEANARDYQLAEAAGVAVPLLLRLKFQGQKIEEAARGLEAVAGLADPVGRLISARELDEGLILRQVTCPLGVVAMIFESRPDALVQIAGLALKSGNGIILKGGSEAWHSNRYLADLVHDTAVKVGVPSGWLYLAETREDVETLLGLNNSVDLIIPRGSNAFVQHVMKNTTIPVLGHADGICHVFADAELDVAQAVPLIVDSKAQYVAVCNAAETLLVHSESAKKLLPAVKTAMDAKGVVLRGCKRTQAILAGIDEATEADWATEYLDYILSVKVVDSLDEAVEHINHWGSHHTDAILTTNTETAEKFMNLVDSADVFWNCSTRFADGFRFGLGAEVGVGTGKIHARGPVGLEGLVIYKWKLYGSGQIVADYVGPRARPFTHRELPAGGRS
jgi:glutamate-5-semialdehyde dehydrogenase